jgi:two-component system, LytTR family, response regulator
MPQIRTLIIEDEPLARKTLEDFAAEVSWLEIVGAAADGRTAVELIDRLKPALIFLDVQMPELSGLEVLRRAAHRPAVVFTTAFDNYAVTAFEFEALDYLLKPFGRERFRQTIERVEKHFGQTANTAQSDPNDMIKRLFVRDKQRIVPLPVEEIVWLEADDDYAIIHAKNKNYLVAISLKEFTQKLDPAKFFRVHRSAIINLDQISEIEEFDRRLRLYMNDGSEVQASRQGSQIIKQFIA